MYEGAGGSPAGGDARLLGLEIVRVSSAAPVREQKAPLGMLSNIQNFQIEVESTQRPTFLPAVWPYVLLNENA